MNAHNHADLFTNPIASSAVRLSRLPKARVIWFDRDYAQSLSEPWAGERGEVEYKNHLLHCCSFVVDPKMSFDAVGWADRYGGLGIGENGGSGRSVLLNGYSVKGIGRTPLIGKTAALTHSSGGAYLEEGVREVVTSQFLARRLPHGALPIIALIDTGIDHTWHLEHGTKVERRVLIVRPFSVRLAHFQRALRFNPRDFKGKRADITRVRHNVSAFSARFGQCAFEDTILQFYMKWAEQIAYAQIHNIVLASSPSNIDLDGRILDFGAVSQIPVLANFFLSPGHTNLDELSNIGRSINQTVSGMNFQENRLNEFIESLTQRVLESYESVLLREILNITVLTQNSSSSNIDHSVRNDVLKAYRHFYHHSTRTRIDLLSTQYKVKIPKNFGLIDIWNENRLPSLDPLAATLERYFGRPLTLVRSNPAAGTVTREHLREEITLVIDDGTVLRDIADVIECFFDRLH